MPEPGKTASPAFKRGQSLDYGEATSANALQALLAQPDAQPEGYQPQDPHESFLFSPTDRPNEPITHGAPFGPGADVSKFQIEGDGPLLVRVAQQIAQQPDQTPEVRAFAARVLRGE